MTENHVTRYTQKLYNCMLRFRGGMLHSVPLERVTRAELMLLAFMHGSDAIVEVRYVGTEPVLDREEEGVQFYVQDEMGEYMRLARKYDTIVNSGRGKEAVETCFRVKLIDFGAVIDAADPVAEIDRKAEEADAAAALSAAAARREETQKRNREIEGGGNPPPLPAAGDPPAGIGSKFGRALGVTSTS